MSILLEAIERIQLLITEARSSQLREPTAMSVATVDEQGRPAVRTLLLKQVDEQGLVFFTNTQSRKGLHLQANPYAAICIYSQATHQQIQFEGTVEAVSNEEADAYWQTRARASQIGAWASKQSTVLADRQMLHDRIAQYTEKFIDQEVPRPDYWSGYRVIPERIEFWHGHPDRLNQRENYQLQDAVWIKEQLYP